MAMFKFVERETLARIQMVLEDLTLRGGTSTCPFMFEQVFRKKDGLTTTSCYNTCGILFPSVRKLSLNRFNDKYWTAGCPCSKLSLKYKIKKLKELIAYNK